MPGGIGRARNLLVSIGAAACHTVPWSWGFSSKSMLHHASILTGTCMLIPLNGISSHLHRFQSRKKITSANPQEMYWPLRLLSFKVLFIRGPSVEIVPAKTQGELLQRGSWHRIISRHTK